MVVLGVHLNNKGAFYNSMKEITNKFDNVNNPKHYTNGKIDCIDAMISAYGITAVMDFCKCNAFKYQWRFEQKNGIEDLHKAAWYNQKYEELRFKRDETTKQPSID